MASARLGRGGNTQGRHCEAINAAQISERAQTGSDSCCHAALELFCALLGSVCGDFVLANGAYQGLYLAGGILPRMAGFLNTSPFHSRLCAKGAMSDYLQSMPVYMITTGQPGLIGAAHTVL
jgi:glucokinase